MRVLDATELERMRATQLASFPDTCTIQQATVTQDSIGSAMRAWSARASGVQCRLRPRSARELMLGSKTTPIGEWLLSLDHAQAIETADRVIVWGRTFEVLTVNNGESDRTATRAGLTEVPR